MMNNKPLSYTDEIWKDIEGYENGYQISNMGRVKNIEREVNTKGNKQRRIRERIRKPSLNKGGYLFVRLSYRTKQKQILVHQEVAMAFIPNVEEKPHINHIDGNKMNNCVNNLEWCTPSENMRHAYDNGLLVIPTGSDHHNAKDGFIVSPWGQLFYLKCRAEFAKIHNLTEVGLSCLFRGVTKTHKGWKLYEKS